MFPQRHLLSNHIKADHSKAVTYQCAYCPEQLKNKKSLQSHVNQHEQTGAKEEGTIYTRNICEKEFTTKKALKTQGRKQGRKQARKQVGWKQGRKQGAWR